MILPEGRSEVEQSLAFKTYDTEELADVCFFRPLGAIIARAALACRSTPNQVTFLAGVVGKCSGPAALRLALGGWWRLDFPSFTAFIDSAEGQLARMTRVTSDAELFLVGVSDYCTATAAAERSRPALLRTGQSSISAWALLANLRIGIQATMSVYHRIAYASMVANGVASENDLSSARAGLIG